MAGALNLKDRNVDVRGALFFALFLVCTYVDVVPREAAAADLPAGFVYVEDVVPGIEVDLRYITEHNFLGRPVDGYMARRCILTRDAAEALGKVQADLNRFGLGLKIFDGYRPQRAVNDFVKWGKDLEDQKTKAAYYPRVAKQDLFREGYISPQSAHSRGSTVDLTIVSQVPNGRGRELDMGTPFDFFGPESWPDSSSVSPSQRAHRMLLSVLMQKRGFACYAQEWWHFTLKNEPFPSTYFDFPIR